MKYEVKHTWGKKGKKETTFRTLEASAFKVLFGPLFQEFAELAKPGDSLTVRLRSLYYQVKVHP